MLNEKEIDALIEKSFLQSAEFVAWVLGKTKFKSRYARCVWSRSDHPWGKIAFSKVDPVTGEEVQVVRDSETDVLVVLEDNNGERFALHIENKLADGHFTDYQPELYRYRAEAWKGKEKWGSYHDYETILFSPLRFFQKNKEAAKCFDSYVSYEEAMIYIPELAANCS